MCEHYAMINLLPDLKRRNAYEYNFLFDDEFTRFQSITNYFEVFKSVY